MSDITPEMPPKCFLKGQEESVVKQQKKMILGEILDVIYRLIRGESAASVGRHYGVNESTIWYIKENEVNIKASIMASTPQSAKVSQITRNVNMEKLEKTLSMWIDDETQKHATPSGPLTRSKAKWFYDHFVQESHGEEGSSSGTPSEPFQASKGCFEKSKSSSQIEENDMSVLRSCYNCTQVITSSKSVPVYEWQTREFCSSNCLGTSIAIEERLESCSVCRNTVSESLKIKLCVRFGSVFEQFCSYSCLDSFKVCHPFCTLCQERILGFMVIYEEQKFCSPFCVSRYGGRGINQMYFGNENPCYICDTVGIHHYEMLKDVSVFFCSKKCIAKYHKEEGPIKCVCALCGCLLLASFDYFYKNGVIHQFCSKQCSNIYIITEAEIVDCCVCQVKKYCFDMIKRQLPGKVEYYCSLTCLHMSHPEPMDAESSGILNSCDQDSVPTLKIRSLDELNEGGIVVDIDQEVSQEVSSIETAPHVSSDVLKKKLEELHSRLFPVTACKGEITNVDNVSSGTQCDDSMHHSGPVHHKAVQVDEPYNGVRGIPVPFPIYVPSPIMRYPCFHPSPMVIPVPVPIPIPIPLLDQVVENHENQSNKLDHKCGEKIASSDDEGESFEVDLAELVTMCGLSDLFPVDEIVIEDSNLTEPEKQHRSPDRQISTDVSPEEMSSESQTQSGTTLESEFLKDETETETKRSKLPENRAHTEGFLASEPTESQTQAEGSPLNEPSVGQTQAKGSPGRRHLECQTQTGVNPASTFSKDMNQNKVSPADEVPVSKPRLIDEDSLTSEIMTLNEEMGRSLWSALVLRKKQDKTFSKKSTLSTNFRLMNNSDRNDYLITLITELLAEKEYHPNILIYTFLCIQKFISKTSGVDSIFLNIFFQRFGKIFYNILQKCSDKFPTITSFLESTRIYSGLKIHETMLWEAFQLGTLSPNVLLFTVMYFNAKIFKFDTEGEHEAMSFKRLHKFSNTRYLKDGTPVMTRSLRYISSSDTEKKIRREIFEDIQNPYKCPFKIHEFYSSKCPIEAILSGNFYFTPILGCCPDSKIWFSSRKLPSCTVRNMLNLILRVDEVQETLYDFHENSILIVSEK